MIAYTRQMRRILIFISLMMSEPAVADYDASWFKAPYWSGEWPRGIAIAKPNLTVMARSEMDKDSAPSIPCTLPYRAVLHPWNHEANKARKIEYWTASKIKILKANRRFDYDFESLDQRSRKPVKLSIKKGEVIEYLIYGAEGSFTVRIRNSLYAAQQDLLTYVSDKADQVSEHTDTAVQFDEWIKLPCADQPSVWILKSDLKKPDSQSDINSDNYIDGIWPAMIEDPGVDDYGVARDLTEEEIKTGHSRKRQ